MTKDELNNKLWELFRTEYGLVSDTAIELVEKVTAIVLEEREACAKVVEEYDTNWDAMHDLYKTLASNIRARNYQ